MLPRPPAPYITAVCYKLDTNVTVPVRTACTLMPTVAHVWFRVMFRLLGEVALLQASVGAVGVPRTV